MGRQITVNGQPMTVTEHRRPASGLRLRIHAAIAIGIGDTILVTGVGAWIAAACTRGDLRPSTVGWIALAGLSIGIVHASYLTVVWSATVASRDWQVDDQERARRWEVEDEERAMRRLLAGNAQEPPPLDNRADFSFVPTLAFEILQRHFAGLPTTRDACVQDGICDQEQWNTVNAVFIAAGMKRKNTLAPGQDLAEAWQNWRDTVQVRRDQVWIRRRKRGWEMLLDR